MRSLSSFNRGVKYLLCIIDVLYKVKTVLYDFVERVNKSKRKPNKLWVDQGKEFCNNLMQNG